MSVRSSFRFVCAFLLVLGALPALDAQEWNCIQVLNDGTVDLNWESDATGAATYSVVPLLPPPDYTPLPASDFDLATYPTGANWPLLTANQEFCFTVYALDGAGSTLAGPSDTLCSIYLEVESGLIPGTVDLGWNSPFHFSPPAGFSGTYAVEQLLPDGSWTVVASAPG